MHARFLALSCNCYIEYVIKIPVKHSKIFGRQFSVVFEVISGI